MDRKTLLEKGFSEEQVTEILNMFHGGSNEVNDLKKKLQDYESKEQDYINIKKKLEDIDKANMSEQEKIEAQKKEIENNLRNSKIIYNKAKAKDLLSGLDIDDELLDSLVSEDENKTVNNATLLKTKMDNLKNLTIQKTKEELSNLDVKPNPSNVNQNNAVNWDTFKKMSADEQNKFAIEHPEEFKNL